MIMEFLTRLIFFILHADTPHCFPKPLSAKEELACFEEMERGNAKAKHKLIEHNLRLVVHIARKYHNSSEEQEELISIGTFGLIKAVDTFDYKKGAKFSTYASRCVEKATLSLRLSKLRKKQNESLFLMYGKFIGKSMKISMFSIVSRKEKFCMLPCIFIHSDF